MRKPTILTKHWWLVNWARDFDGYEVGMYRPASEAQINAMFYGYKYTRNAWREV